jgi:hypothetical protein
LVGERRAEDALRIKAEAKAEEPRVEEKERWASRKSKLAEETS